MAETLTERVARAIRTELFDINGCYCDCGDKAAKIAIAVVIEEAAKVADAEAEALRLVADLEGRIVAQSIAAAIRRLAE